MATTAEAFDLALKYHQAGQHAGAEQVCRQIVQADPTHADALHLLGVLVYHQGRPDLAVQYIRQALTYQPLNANYYSNLGLVYTTLGRYDEAVACCSQALTIDPDQVGAHFNRGVAYHHQGKLDEAEASYRHVLHLRPDFPDALDNLGALLGKRGRLEEAEASYQRVLAVAPGHANAYNNLGCLLRDHGRLEEAAAAFHEALRTQPGHLQARNNLGVNCMLQGQVQRALDCWEQTLRLDPGFPDAHHNRSLAWLLLGDFARGWPESEWRWKCAGLSPPRGFTQPLWDRSPLGRRTILLHPEQGLGDTIQFVRYAPLVKRHGGTVLVECPDTLLGLFESCAGIDRLVLLGQALPAFDVYAPLLSLPGILGTTLDTTPADVPYLHADARLVRHWQAILRRTGDLQIGIVWQGSPGHTRDRTRSVPLQRFAVLAALEGLRLFSLQLGSGTEQLATATFAVTDLSSRIKTFADTAAAVVNLDLVITVDTAVAHLAGALGVPAWVVLSSPPDWRWLLEREDCPWHPSLRLFRQSSPGDWEGVFERMAEDLRRVR